MTGGTYTLPIDLPAPVSISVGALGRHDFDTGFYAYTGSAFGAGGFSRVERHRELARGERTTSHWHVDYLLQIESSRVVDVVRTPGAAIECAVAEQLPDAGIPGFGSSDCPCPSHLAYGDERDGLLAQVRRAHERV